MSPLPGEGWRFESVIEYQRRTNLAEVGEDDAPIRHISLFIRQINRGGPRTRLENAGYGDELYGDRHFSLAPNEKLDFLPKSGKIYT